MKLKRLTSLLHFHIPDKNAVNVQAKVLYITLLFCGLFAGYCLCALMENALLTVSYEAGKRTAFAVSRRAPSFANSRFTGGIDGFTEGNPFGADIKVVKSKSTEKVKPLPEALKSMTLHGTLPDIGAWIDAGEEAVLVLKGQTIEGFTLSDIGYREATLYDGHEEHALHLLLSGGEQQTQSKKQPPTRRTNTRKRQTERRTETRLDFSGLEPASEGQEGAVPRELVDALLMNPYDELAKVRMVPTPDSSGMRLERLSSDSILSRVGVAQGDVISAVNGVQITNVADATNALSSLISGNRFDVTVVRGGKPIDLRYQVK